MQEKQYKVELSEEAEDDFDKTYAYYSKESHKVADAFFQRVDSSLEHLSLQPFAYPEIYRNIRKSVVKKFPFVIYYQIMSALRKVTFLPLKHKITKFH